MQEVADSLADALPALARWGEETTLVHGDCKPSQFLVNPEGVAILDFDPFWHGGPCLRRGQLDGHTAPARPASRAQGERGSGIARQRALAPQFGQNLPEFVPGNVRQRRRTGTTSLLVSGGLAGPKGLSQLAKEPSLPAPAGADARSEGMSGFLRRAGRQGRSPERFVIGGRQLSSGASTRRPGDVVSAPSLSTCS